MTWKQITCLQNKKNILIVWHSFSCVSWRKVLNHKAEMMNLCKVWSETVVLLKNSKWNFPDALLLKSGGEVTHPSRSMNTSRVIKPEVSETFLTKVKLGNLCEMLLILSRSVWNFSFPFHSRSLHYFQLQWNEKWDWELIMRSSSGNSFLLTAFW